jgi:hypothetical protein
MPTRVKMARPTITYTQWNHPLILPKNSFACLCIASHILDPNSRHTHAHPPTLKKWRMDDTLTL